MTDKKEHYKARLLDLIQRNQLHAKDANDKAEIKRTVGVDAEIADIIKYDPKDIVILCLELDERGLILPDNLTKECDWGCGKIVQYRPDAPEGAKVCMNCIYSRPQKVS